MKIKKCPSLSSLVLTLGLVLTFYACKHSSSSSEVKIIDGSMLDKDLLSKGSYAFDAYEYETPAAIDQEISPLVKGDKDYPIDFRGRLFLPRSQEAHPLLVFLHGNHSTCGTPPKQKGDPRIDDSSEFSSTGSCPAGKVEAPSYRGYDAQAEFLATHGYAVISINANRGVTALNGDETDPGLVYARGLLVLKHIEQLQKWAQLEKVPTIASKAVDLRKRIDWSEIGVMGHSRGGEGVRYAHNILKNYKTAPAWQKRLPGVQIKGVFEVAPVDFGSKMVEGLSRANAQGAAWSVLIPGCDEDVSDFSGIGPFVRMGDQADGLAKSIFTIWGANHNFFNSEWQESDANSCKNNQKPLWDISGAPLPGSDTAKAGLTGSAIQRNYLKGLMFAFFRAHVGKKRWPEGARVFDPQYHLPKQLSDMAPSSREFVIHGSASSVFSGSQAISRQNTQVKITDLLTHTQNEFDKLASEGIKFFAQQGKKVRFFYSDANYDRPSWVISSADGSQEASVEVPFNKAEDLAGIWTVDMAVAKYEYCGDLQGKTCLGSGDDNLKLSLLYADGSASQSVLFRDYLKFAKANPPMFHFNKEQIDEKSGEKHMYFKAIAPIFQTARFEVKDFGSSKGPVKGLKLTFPKGSSYSMLVHTVNLTKKSP